MVSQPLRDALEACRDEFAGSLGLILDALMRGDADEIEASWKRVIEDALDES